MQKSGRDGYIYRLVRIFGCFSGSVTGLEISPLPSVSHDDEMGFCHDDIDASASHDDVMDFGWEAGKPVRLCEDYQAKSNTMSRGMPAALTLAMSAASSSVIDACSAEYCCANSRFPVA